MVAPLSIYSPQDDDFEELAHIIVHQMVCLELVHSDPETLGQHLDENDAEAMVDLVRLTEPGPFEIETVKFGNYFGVYEAGQLMAMVGQRMGFPGWVEISAVCSHPAAQGRGYASRLVTRVAQAIIAAGDQPFLHVGEGGASKKTAILVYEKTGFRHHQKMTIQVLQRR